MQSRKTCTLIGSDSAKSPPIAVDIRYGQATRTTCSSDLADRFLLTMNVFKLVCKRCRVGALIIAQPHEPYDVRRERYYTTRPLVNQDFVSSSPTFVLIVSKTRIIETTSWHHTVSSMCDEPTSRRFPSISPSSTTTSPPVEGVRPICLRRRKLMTSNRDSFFHSLRRKASARTAREFQYG